LSTTAWNSFASSISSTASSHITSFVPPFTCDF
jgi:hypothetical protein